MRGYLISTFIGGSRLRHRFVKLEQVQLLTHPQVHDFKMEITYNPEVDAVHLKLADSIGRGEVVTLEILGLPHEKLVSRRGFRCDWHGDNRHC
jgi:hypothetical protein